MTIEFQQLIIPLISFSVGFFVGALMSHYLCKSSKKLIKASEGFAWLLSFIWVGLHVYGLITGAFKVPWVFDVIGGMTIGHVIGYDVTTVIEAIRKK